jgi:transmembrane sensor
MVLTASTELEVLSNDGHRFVTLLRRGSCGFSVTPGGPRRWSIETDLATVEVVGTEFTVNRHAEGLAVHVTRGVVLVRGEHVPGRVQRLGAGQALEVRDTRALEQTEMPLRTTAPAANEAPASATATSETTRSEGIASIPRRAFDFDTEMEQADRARAEGRFDDAARILSAALREGGDDSQAAIAGFSLGRLQLDILNRPNDAATTFCAVVRRGSPRALVEDAQARCIEALARAGRRDEAIRQARVYETRWPDGRRLAEVRAFVAQ